MRMTKLTRLWATVTGRRENPYYDPSKPHHTRYGFRNNYQDVSPSGWDVLRWQWQRTRAGLPKPPASPVLPVKPDLDYLHGNRDDVAVTWLGHATLLVQTGGLNILTDPLFDERASPLSFAGPKRHQPPPLTPSELPTLDAVVLSHTHYDHLSLASLRSLYRQPGGPPVFFLPLGVDLWFAANVSGGDRSRLKVLDWWDAASYRGVEFTLLPVQHWSSRTPWDKNTTLWGAWAMRRPDFSFFFSGDLGYSQDVRDIGAHIGGFDLAAIAIGAYEPRWFMRPQHINPEEAVRVHQDIRARRSIGIHWGTFEGLTDEPLDQPPRDLAAAREAAGLPASEFFVLRPGETFRPSVEEGAEPAAVYQPEPGASDTPMSGW